VFTYIYLWGFGYVKNTTINSFNKLIEFRDEKLPTYNPSQSTNNTCTQFGANWLDCGLTLETSNRFLISWNRKKCINKQR